MEKFPVKRRRSKSCEDSPTKRLKLRMEQDPGPLVLTSLPLEIVEHILGFLNFTETAKIRRVNRALCVAGNNLLKKGFQEIQNLVTSRVAELKQQMPRRESVRHKHPLARECDIYQSINVKLSLLRLHFGKYINAGACSFYPGQVLDEVKSIMRYIKTTAGELDYAYVITTELSDLCHMAIEYHNDHLPKMPKNQPSTPLVTLPFNFNSGSSNSSSSIRSAMEASQMRMNQSIDRMSQMMNRAKQGIGGPKPKPPNIKHYRCRRRIYLTNQRLQLCQKTLKHHKSKLTRYERHFQDLARKVETLTKELAECRDEIKDIKDNI